MAKKPTEKYSVQEKFVMVREDMAKSLIERHDEIDLVLTGLISNDHPLLVGPPGTGKSLLIDSLMRWMSGDVKKYSILLNRFSMPDEVFGPISVAGLKKGVYDRITTNKLPEADLAFVDEIFKASTAVLNTMLKILNERKFEKGDGTQIKCPLRIALAASNKWPDAEELGALFDRFLLRKTVKQVTAIGRKRLLRERSHEPNFRTSITAKELDTATKEAAALEFTDAAWEGYDKILSALNKEGIRPGDRRMKKAVNICRSFAYLRGDDEVRADHLEVLKYVLWDSAEEQEQRCHKIISGIANPVGSQITELLLQAASVVESDVVPEERVQKLQDILKSTKALPEHDKKNNAIGFVQNHIKSQYNKVIGLEE